MNLLKLLEQVKNGQQLTAMERELLASLEIHLMALVDVLGMYVELRRDMEKDKGIYQILLGLQEKLCGRPETPEGRTGRGIDSQDYPGARQGAM